MLRPSSDLTLGWLRLAGDHTTRGAVDWYVAHARDTRPSLRGDELITLGVPRGPEVARALRDLWDARVDGRIADREAETEYVRQWVQTREEG
jgi:tRNA nucleotidyltransferase (CCA-adding enzyme)